MAYTRDGSGELAQMVYPSGRLVTIARASDGQVTGVTTASGVGGTETVASAVAYRPFGPLSGLTFGNGLALSRSFDGNHWLMGIAVAGGGVTRLDLAFTRDGAGALTGVVDTVGGRGASFGYSDAGRLTSATGPWGADAYAYDAAGNRTGFSRTIGSTALIADQVLPAGSNRIAAVRDGAGMAQRSFTHRAGGNVAQEARTRGVTYGYGYNARHRLSSVTADGVQVGAYGYDAFGRRIWRQVFGPGAAHLHYVFDLEGRLLAEHDATSGYVLREYVWLDDLPLAVIDSSGAGARQTYFIHAGQLDEPIMMTDAAGAVAWEAYQEPFGAAVVFGASGAALDLRLPGQSLQAETGGLHQNWHRDYDPSTGRYLEADPLGLEAGQNLYAYVDGDPLNAVDVEGLQRGRPRNVPAQGSPGAAPTPQGSVFDDVGRDVSRNWRRYLWTLFGRPVLIPFPVTRRERIRDVHLMKSAIDFMMQMWRSATPYT